MRAFKCTRPKTNDVMFVLTECKDVIEICLSDKDYSEIALSDIIFAATAESEGKPSAEQASPGSVIEHLRYVFYYRLSTGQTVADLMAESDWQRVIEITNALSVGRCANEAMAALGRAVDETALSDETITMMVRDTVKWYRGETST